MGFKPHVAHFPFGDPIRDFSPFAEERESFLLDASLFHPDTGRYSYWGVSPLVTFSSQGGFITQNGRRCIGSPQDTLRRCYGKIESIPADPYFPFSGGLVGYLGYEWGTALENIEPHPLQDPPLPDSRFGLFDTIVGYDHLEKSSRILSLGLDDNLEPNATLAEEKAFALLLRIKKNRRIHQEAAVPAVRSNANGSGNGLKQTGWKSSFTRETYDRAFRKIKTYLTAGDCYQINLTQRFEAPAPLSPWEYYLRLRTVSPAPFSAFMNTGNFQILSSSPELLLKGEPCGKLTTQPIKGTRPRGKTEGEDNALRRELEESDKDRAELLMITDLERNDLGKVCKPGTVKVKKLQQTESFSQVHHLCSVIEGERKQECNIVDALVALSPGGSITGAPKIRAMEIIRELEPVRRGVYTGSIGWIGPENGCRMNIAIRTMILHNQKAYFHAGGGIVIDSDATLEYEELLTKAKGMMETLR